MAKLYSGLVTPDTLYLKYQLQVGITLELGQSWKPLDTSTGKRNWKKVREKYIWYNLICKYIIFYKIKNREFCVKHIWTVWISINKIKLIL